MSCLPINESLTVFPAQINEKMTMIAQTTLENVVWRSSVTYLMP